MDVGYMQHHITLHKGFEHSDLGIVRGSWSQSLQIRRASYRLERVTQIDAIAPLRYPHPLPSELSSLPYLLAQALAKPDTDHVSSHILQDVYYWALALPRSCSLSPTVLFVQYNQYQ